MAYQQGGPPHKRQRVRGRANVSDPFESAAVEAITLGSHLKQIHCPINWLSQVTAPLRVEPEERRHG